MNISKRFRKTLTILPIVGTILFTSISVRAELGDSLLKKGSDHADVKVLQERLIELNFLDIDETNTYYGDTTFQAVKDFQSFYGLDDDGAFGSETFETLESVSKILPLEFKEILRLDMKGDQVKHLQERLVIMGFLNEEDIDSSYGPKTEQAVKSFQEVYKLEADGIAGSSTIEAINKALDGSKRMRRPLTSRGATSSRNLDLIAAARKYIGTPYRYGGTSSRGFDCSGFTQAVFKSQGITLPRATTGQARVGAKLSKSELRTGDLVIFSGTYKAGPSHTGIYIGNGDFIHASSSRGVVVSNLSESYYARHFSYGRRVN